MKFTLFKHLSREWLLFILISLGIFSLGRIYLYGKIAASITDMSSKDIFAAFLMGFRFDIKIIATVLAIFVLLAIFGLFFEKLHADWAPKTLFAWEIQYNQTGVE